MALFKLLPFNLSEMKTAGLLSDNFADNVVSGFYSALFDRKIEPKIFYSNYIQTYIQKDITELLYVKDSTLFRNFIVLCATRVGQLLNLNAIAGECGISQPTAKPRLSVLESSYIVFLLQPFPENFSKRIIKTPKLYFYDTGLLCHLLKLNNPDTIYTHTYKSALFENMIISEMLKQNEHFYLHRGFWFWRDSERHETDLLMQSDDELNTIEIKAT